MHNYYTEQKKKNPIHTTVLFMLFERLHVMRVLGSVEFIFTYSRRSNNIGLELVGSAYGTNGALKPFLMLYKSKPSHLYYKYVPSNKTDMLPADTIIRAYYFPFNSLPGYKSQVLKNHFYYSVFWFNNDFMFIIHSLNFDRAFSSIVRTATCHELEKNIWINHIFRFPRVFKQLLILFLFLLEKPRKLDLNHFDQFCWNEHILIICFKTTVGRAIMFCIQNNSEL